MRKLSLVLAGAAILAAAPLSAQDKDIIETAAAAGNFKTLTAAITTAGLTDTFRGPGPFTLFAPSDEAFAKLPKAQLDALLADKDALKAVLLYHVVPGRVMAADAVRRAGRPAKMASGAEAKFSVMGTTVMVNDAHVTQADMAAKNGVIHVIDAVIWPARP